MSNYPLGVTDADIEEAFAGPRPTCDQCSHYQYLADGCGVCMRACGLWVEETDPLPLEMPHWVAGHLIEGLDEACDWYDFVR